MLHYIEKTVIITAMYYNSVQQPNLNLTCTATYSYDWPKVSTETMINTLTFNKISLQDKNCKIKMFAHTFFLNLIFRYF